MKTLQSRAKRLWCRSIAVLYGMTGLLLAIIFYLDILTPAGITLPILYIVPVILVGVWSSPRAILAVTIVGGLGTALGTAAYFLAPTGSHDDVAIANRVLALFGLWLSVVIILLRKGFEQDREMQTILETTLHRSLES
jgi:hypothetical protein